MSDFKNELEQEVEFINDLISRYLPDETGLDKKNKRSYELQRQCRWQKSKTNAYA